MKTLIKISIIFLLLTSASGNAQILNQVDSYTDLNCNNISSGFKISKGHFAYKFDLKISPEWIDCNSAGSTQYNMVGIRLKDNSRFVYQCYIYKNGDLRESSALSEFIIGSGDYELVISSNPGNSVRLTYYTGTEIALNISHR